LARYFKVLYLSRSYVCIRYLGMYVGNWGTRIDMQLIRSAIGGYRYIIYHKVNDDNAPKM